MTRSLLLAVFFLPMAACTLTPVAVVDSYAGFEHVVGKRSAHLESMRSAITKCESDDEKQTYRFHLDAVLSNETDQTWIVRRKDWDLQAEHLTDDSSVEVTVALAGGGAPEDTMIAVPPTATGKVRLVLDIGLPLGTEIDEIERSRVMLRFGDQGNQLMEKRISIGVFNQAGQAVRIFGVVTLALVVLSFA